MCISGIDRPNLTPTYDEFLRLYLKSNIPVIFSAELLDGWASTKEWIQLPPSTSTSDVEPNQINWNHLSSAYGHHEVSVADCSRKDSFGNLECEYLRFADVVSKWQAGQGQSLYVKDWHLARAVEGHPAVSLSSYPGPSFYNIPDLFKDDWMNAYYSAHTTDDFRFVYVGVAGTFTPLHRDVYCSYSWSTNVCGRKRWWLFPPAQTRYLFIKGRNTCVYDVRNVDAIQFPEFAKTTPVVVEQEAGETIFVQVLLTTRCYDSHSLLERPSGWYHQVENLTDCISINHNWCNSVNLPMLYSSMCDKVVEVEDALDDVRELLKSSQSRSDKLWEAEFCTIVQELVRQDAGWK
jgi:hypothetical protein